MTLLKSIRMISASLLLNLGFDSEAIREIGKSFFGEIPKRLAYRFFVVSFILWILYIILGKDPEIKAKLKRIVLFAYFVPMILFSLFNYSTSILDISDTATDLNMSDHLIKICHGIVLGGAWPFIILADIYTERVAREAQEKLVTDENELAGDYGEEIV